MNKKKKIITLLSVLLVLMITIPGVVEAKQLFSRRDLTSGPNVGNTIMLGTTYNSQPLNMFNENDHLYCIQHRATTRTALYRVDAFVEITGNKATGHTSNGKKTKYSTDNIVLAYVCGEQNYYKGYNNGNSDKGVRMRAIHKYLQTWYNDVAFPSLGLNRKWNDSGFSLDNHKAVKERALKLINDGINYAKTANTSVPEIDKNNTTKEIESISATTYGPFKIKYNGIIESVVVKDNSGNEISGIKISTDEEGKNIINVTDIESNKNYYIQNNSGKEPKTFNIKLKDSEVLSAKIWFLERNDGLNSQRFITVDTGKIKAQGETYVINIKPKVSIQGYVWIDEQRTKANDTNSLYDDDEKRVAGVTVNLVNKSSKKIVATTKTDSNGSYIFNRLIATSKLKDHYIEFNYKGIKVGNNDISKYIPVAFNSTIASEIKENGSRALMNEVAEEDKNLAGIATTYTGTDKELTYGLGYGGNLYNKLMKDESLNNINLGLKKIPETEFIIYENLANVKIGIKGYEYTYIYGETGDKSKVAAPTVRWQGNDISAYSRKIYPSDILYKSENANEMLSVDVTYNIDITNTTTHNIEELYQEQQLVIKSLTNIYDAKRYKLNDNNWELVTDENEKTGTAKYKGDKLAKGIASNSSSPTVSITFSVNREALLEILKNPTGIIENYPTRAIATGYHKYKRKDYSWKNNLTEEQTHYTEDDTRESTAPYLIFQLGEERILSGKVFEDKAINSTNGQKLGNGLYDNGENSVKDVKVELLDVIVENGKETVQTSHLYGLNEDGTEYTKEAIVKSGNDGTYTLNGIVPGIYYLRFTYGDGTQKIIELNTEKDLAAKDYKSTIVTNNVAKQALKGGTDLEWYKKLGTLNASVAIDSMESRIAVNEGTRQDMLAGTAKVSITIENTPTNVQNLQVTNNGQNVASTNKFEGLNLGVIEQPEQRVELEKIITNMKLTNAQNNLIFNGNPETTQMVGVSDLDGKTNGGSTYARVEIDESSIYGSTLELTYGIKVTNTSDLNYYDYDYYRFGDINNENKEVTINVKEVLDYLDKTLTFNKEASSQGIEVKASTDGNITDNTLSLGISGVLYTSNNKTRKTDVKTSADVSLVAQRILSNQDDDMEIINEVEVKSEGLENATDTRDNSANKETEIKTVKPITANYKTKATTTITPPTGADRQTLIIYVIAGIIALAVLSTGVVFIRKFVKK